MQGYWHNYLFVLLLVGGVVFAAVRGGAPERLGFAIATIGTIATVLFGPHGASHYGVTHMSVVAVDAATFVAFSALAITADRFWPMPVASLQAAAVTIHLCRLLEPEMLPFGYSIGVKVWGYLILLLMIAGTERHRKRVRFSGGDCAWSRRCYTSRNGIPGETRPS